MNEHHKHSPGAASQKPRETAGWRRALLGAESRWPAFAVAFVIIVGQACLASSLQLRPVWLLPGVVAVLLIARSPSTSHRRNRAGSIAA